MAKLFDRTIDGMISCDNLHQNQELNIRFLLDTGALQANYISLDLANKLRERGCFYQAHGLFSYYEVQGYRIERINFF
jgi:hypothetical protein